MCDITELGNDKRGPALRNLHKRFPDRDRVKDPNNGVKYFKSFLRSLFVKGAANLILYRFQQFMNLHRGYGDMLRWITRFQLSVQRTQGAYCRRDAEVRAGLPAEEQADLSSEERMKGANERLRDQRATTSRTTTLPRLCSWHRVPRDLVSPSS